MKLASLLLLGAVTASAQQLPPGTRDAATPPPADPAFVQAEAALEKSDFATALPLLTKLAAAHPDDATIAYDLGFTQDGLGQTTDAEAAYRKAMTLKPDYAEAEISLGLLLARQGKSYDAHGFLQAAANSITADPAIKAAADRALAQLDEQTKPALAREELLAALKLSPETPADMMLAAQLADAAHDPSAEAAYRRVLAIDPDNQQAKAGLLHVLVQQGKSSQAEPDLQAAVAAHPEDAALKAQLIQTYIAEKKLDQALPLAEGLHATHPQDASATRLLAGLYDQMKQPAKSEPLYAELQAQTPDDPMVLDAHAAALIQLSKPADAEKLLKQALVFQNSFADKQQIGLVASHLAFAASQADDPTTVLDALALRAKYLPATPSSLYLQATALDRLQQSGKAAEFYRQFLAVAAGQFPDEEAQARKRLSYLGHR